jgi:hypothetical protein
MYQLGWYLSLWRKRTNSKRITIQAKEIYLKMNSYSYPNTMNDIEREWILKKIEEGIKDYCK